MPHVLVVGGGSTGTAVARDLARRGADVTLVERGSLAAGTTGRMHGLLHSGARYANADPESARDCAAENAVLREVAPHCVTDTGGLFVQHPDDEAYLDAKAAACRDCDVPVERLSASAAREAEPALAEDVTGALRVPDAAVDPFLLCASNAVAAESAGARVHTGTAVTDLHVEAGRVVGAELEDGGVVETDHVVNAAGPWADRVAGLAGCAAPVRHSQGAMVVVDSPLATIVNRCRPKGEGDIAVPHGAGAVLGTTDEAVDGPDAVDRDPEAVDRVVGQLAAVLPAVGDAPRLHAYWGVRPLADPTAAGPGEATRDFAVVDHRAADGVRGLTSVVGGKVTTSRLMAERVTDRVCASLDVAAACRTATEPLPVPGEAALARFGLDGGDRPPVAVSEAGSGL